MNKITYLFGAGASAQALPIVNQMPAVMQIMIDKLRTPAFTLSLTEELLPGLPGTVEDNKIEMIDEIQWLCDSCKNHASVDTFAKKLYITRNNEDLNRLKAILSVFLELIQIEKLPDKRYDSFYASLLGGHATDFPSNVRILSWNYDYQFERNYAEFSGDKRITAALPALNVLHKYLKYRHIENDRFRLIKLNGTSSLLAKTGNEQYHFVSTFANDLTKEILHEIVKLYWLLRFRKNAYCGLSFAWEKESEFIHNTIAETADTDVLVIIGYSFPFFNREVDRQIIKAMLNLRKVYFQSPEAAAIKERFQAIREDLKDGQLVPYNDCWQFLLPNEL